MSLKKNLEAMVKKLSGKKVLFITTSNRWSGSDDRPKTDILAEKLGKKLDAKIIDASKLHIYHCEGNISDKSGNSCGVPKSILKDKEKNPTGNHRCWASINHKDDELWIISKAIFEADAVIFFIPVRWGQANAFYQKLIERLSWIENRWTTLEGDQLMKGKIGGCFVLGHNWKAEEVMETQKSVYEMYGFDVPDECSAYWQWTFDMTDETREGYLEDSKDFLSEIEELQSAKYLKESFSEWLDTIL